jgi:hypothetical protein
MHTIAVCPAAPAPTSLQLHILLWQKELVRRAVR